MSRIIRADYDQMYLLPPSVDDWVPADHPARFIRDFVDALDLEALGFVVPEGIDGRPAYACDLLLKVWLYGYFSKVRSTRGLERACYDSMALVWLTGNHHPDHNTLWRFWKKNRAALKGVFQSSVRVAVRNDLVSLALQAVDGTKIPAQVSTARAEHRQDLEKLLVRLDGAIEEMERAVRTAEDEETGTCRLPASMVDAVERRERIRRTLKEMDATGRDHRHPRDPEARVVKCREGKRLGYNAQAVCEENHRLVVASEVADAENDYGQLTPMIEEATETVGAPCEETLADSGYWSGEDLAAAEENERKVLVATPRPKQGGAYAKAAFRYDPGRDVYICPHGEALVFERTRAWRGKHESRVYRCANGTCPFRAACTKDPRGRSVEREPFYEAVERQKRRQAKPENRARMRRRKVIAEPPFAYLKQLLGFRRWTVRGLENVRAQWSLLCATLNLRVLYGEWKKGGLELAPA